MFEANKSIHLVSAVALGLALSAASSAQAQTSTYDLQTGTGRLVSIANTGTPLSFSSADDGTASFTLPFGFEFFGDPIAASSTAYVNTNGTLNLLSSSNDLGNDQIPSSSAPNGMVVAFWDDMTVSGATGWWAAAGTAGNEILVVEWTDFKRLGSNDTITVQVRIYRSTGRIEVLYGARVGGGSTSASIGIEGPQGQFGVGLPCGTSCQYDDVPAGTMLTYEPIPLPPQAVDLQVSSVSSPPATVADGGTLTIDYEIANIGTVLANSSVAALYLSDVAPVGTNAVELATQAVSGVIGGGVQRGTFIVTLPPGLPQTSTYYLAVVADAGDDVVEIDDSNNIRQAGQFRIGAAPSGQISVTTQTLSQARAGDPYSVQLQQTGATAPRWRIASGRLPDGLSLATSGLISGTPLRAERSGFRVEAEQEGFSPGSADLVLTVSEAGSLRVDTAALPEAFVGQPYSASVTASGGMTPYAFQAVRGAPSWLLVGSDGVMSGMPDVAGEFEIELSVFDSNGAFSSSTLTLEVVVAGPLALTTTARDVPAGQTGVAYSFTFQAEGGRRPYVWTLTGGELPSGLQLDSSTGLLGGRPATVGDFGFTVGLQDAEGATGSISLTVRVTEPIPLSLRLPETISLPFGAPADFTLSAQGGMPPYSWSHEGGLPAGLSIEGGRIVGVATSSTASTVVFAVTDALLERASAEVTVHATEGGGANPGGNAGGGSPGGLGRNRSGGSGRGGGRRSGGCVCVQPASSPISSGLVWLSAAGLLSIGWRRRRSVMNTKRASTQRS